jgi:hypothetical protein
MGLRLLEWHEQKNNGWVARIAYKHDEHGKATQHRRFAHVNIRPWYVGGRPGEVFVEFQQAGNAYENTWHDSIELAKTYVEAIFALEY